MLIYDFACTLLLQSSVLSQLRYLSQYILFRLNKTEMICSLKLKFIYHL